MGLEKVGGIAVKSFPLHHLPVPVARVLRSFYGLQRLYRLLGILGGAAVLYLLLALAVMHADRFFFLTVEIRILLWRLVHGLTAGVLAARLILFFLRRPSVRQVAYDLQGRLPDLAAEQYVTLDSVLREPAAVENAVRRDLLDHLAAATEAHSATVKPLRLVRDRALARMAVALASVAVFYGALAVIPGYQFPLMIRRFLQPGANLPKPSFVRIRVTPDAIVIGRGGDVVIQAAVEGRIPPGLGWLYRLAGAVPNRCVMAAQPGRRADVRLDPAAAVEWSRIQRQLFLYSKTGVRESFSYRLRCGDAETEVRLVEVVDPPRITEVRLRARPPAYTRLPPEEFVNPKQPVRLYEGSAVELAFTVDQAVTNRQVTAATKPLPLSAWDASNRTGLCAFTMTGKADLDVRVVNARGFANADRVRVSLSLRADQAPVVRLDYPAGDLTVVPGELVPLQAQAEDDLEVVSALVRFQLNPELNPDAPAQDMPVTPGGSPGPRVSLTVALDLGQTPAGPGDELVMMVRVRDSKGNDGESRPVRIRVNAFTRGENERRRLAALDAVKGCLSAWDPGSAGFDKARYGAAVKTAAGAGVTLGETPSMDSLMRLMEFEQHFTDAPRHKEDVRRLSAVIGYAAMAGRLPEGDGGSWPDVVSREILAPLDASRRLQNVTWRLFGLKEEVAGIRRRLGGASSPDANLNSVQSGVLAAFISALAEEGAGNAAAREAAGKERALARQIDALSASAAAAPEEEGEVVANPFAQTELDVEVAAKTPEQAKQLAELNRKLAGAVSERKRLVAAWAADATARWVQGRKGQPLPLPEPELAMLAAAAADRLLRPPAGAAPLADAEAVRAWATALAADRLKERQGGESPEQKSLQRRADLYRKALEEIGIDLAAVAEAAPGRLDGGRLRGLQAEINTAGYYLSRGNAARGTAACDDVDRLLAQCLAAVRPALPALMRDERKARERLESLSDSARSAIAGRPLSEPGRRWIERDLQMLERNPFSPIWEQALDLGMSGEAAVTPPEPAVAAAAAEERRFWNLMAAEWEIADLQASARISPAEKALAAGVVAYGALLDGGAATAGAAADVEQDLLRQPLDTMVPVPLTAGERVRRERQAMNLRAMEAVLIPAMKSRAFARTPLEQAIAARERLTGAARLTEALDAALTAGEGGVQPAIREATGALTLAVQECDRVVRLAALDAGYLDPLGPEAPREETLLVRVREATARYRGRAGESVRVMGEMAGRELDAAQLGNLGAELTIVRAGVQALQKSLETAIAEYGAGKDGQADMILKPFAETRAALRDARELSGGDPAGVAARLIRESPAARFAFLEARSAMLEAALQELEAAGTLLEQPGSDAALVQKIIGAARTGLGAFEEALGKAGPGDLQETTGKGVADLAGRLERLGKSGESDDKRRFLAVAEMVKDGNRLLRGLRAGARAGAGESLEYAGGPDGIWAPESRLSAEGSRQRLLGQVDFGRRAVTMGILEALEPAPDVRRYGDAAAWGLFGHRAARSPLSGAATPPRTRAGGDGGQDPLVTWLLEQADEAARETQDENTLQHYRGITRELIPVLRDYLRY